ncbi:AAA-ATPase At3g50940 [Linum grandiflorum]
MWSLPDTITFPPIRLPPLSEAQLLFSTAASLAGSALLFRSTVYNLLPDTLTGYLSSRINRLTTGISSQLTVVIHDSDGLTPNQMFAAANLYLAAKLSQSTARIKVNKLDKEKALDVTIDCNEELVHLFKGAKMKWSLSSSLVSSNSVPFSSRAGSGMHTTFVRPEVHHFELTFHKKYRKLVLGTYLPHILAEAKSIREAKKTLKLHTIDYNGIDYWGSIVFDHPATFDTIAMDPEAKKALVADLETFIDRKDYYRKVGKAWKRGYLLYGPPGTGKSSLVAAMANYLKFDIYDLDLKEVQCNSDLRRLLIGTGNRSILVLEDIDRTVATIDQAEKVTLAGLLNFVDGLWSTCGEERILVFTTNNKEELDPALLRPGRIDVELNMSYCSFTAFKTLAYNYFEETEHELFGEIKELLQDVDATPAEIAGELLKSKNVDVAMHGVVKLLRSKESAGATGTRTVVPLSLGMVAQKAASENGVSPLAVERNSWGGAFHYNGYE